MIALVEGLLQRLSSMAGRTQALEDRQSKDSHNSGKPPSSDGLARKPASQREKSERKQGGQKGHPGKTLELRDDPVECARCGGSLSEADTVET